MFSPIALLITLAFCFQCTSQLYGQPTRAVANPTGEPETTGMNVRPVAGNERLANLVGPIDGLSYAKGSGKPTAKSGKVGTRPGFPTVEGKPGGVGTGDNTGPLPGL